MLDTAPLLWFRCGADQTRRSDPGNAPPYCAFLAELSAEDAAQLEAARQELSSERTSFTQLVRTCQGGTFAIEGRRTTTGEAVLWVAEASGAKRAERQADRLREMLDTIPMPVWRRDAEDSLVDCNRAYAEAVGTSVELAVAEGRELAPGIRALEPRHVVVAGARRLFEFSHLPAQESGTIGFAIDRTDVERAETELWRQVNAYSEVLESVRAAVAIYGPDRRLKFFNAVFASTWELPEGWLATQPSFDEILERLREARRLPEAADFRAYKREQLQMFTSVIEPQHDLMHLPDDRTLLLSISPHPLGGLAFIYEDVTDRLALERSCNTLTQVRRATLDHLFEGIAVYGSDGRLKLHNPAFLALWGLSDSDVAGEPHIADVLEKVRGLLDQGADWPTIKEGIVAKITAHAPASGPVYRNDGSMLQEATVPLPDGDVLVTYLDVTDTARVERALRERNEALETAARLKSEFVANISYELRMPLNAVIGFADILAKQYFGDLNPRQLDYARYIMQSARQLMRLINDICDLAAIETGSIVLEPGPVEVLDILQAVLNLTRERAKSRDLEIELQYPLDIGTIEADGKRLTQALFNLMCNAVRFTPPGGAIGLEAERVGDELLLSVADSGIGIPPSDRIQALERASRAIRRPSAGLGLSLVKSLIELHGGSLTIDSAPGGGTRVTCRLPVAGSVAHHRAAMVESETRAAA